jgi:DNA polymerase/3'-5' exonuclease PolX
MNSTTIVEYIQELEKRNEQLKELYRKSEEERVATLEKLNSKLLDESIQRVGAVLNEPSLFETTARTKTHTLNKEIADHLKELGEMTSDFYKAAAYNMAADTIATLDFEVQNGESLLEIKGIGKGIASKVDQFLDEYFDDSESVTSNEGQILEDSDDDTDCSYAPGSQDPDEMMFSYHIADMLYDCAIKADDEYKRKAYEKAADTVYNLNYEIKSGKEAMKLPGIGKGIAKKIDEFLESWKVKKLELEESSDDDDEFFVSYNSELADVLDELAYHEEDEHKSAAYDRAANIIDHLPFKVTSGKELAKGPKKVKGIGKSIASVIDEFLSTGKVKKLETLEKGVSTNDEIAQALDDYADDLEDPFKIRAYRNAAKTINGLDFEVTSGEELAEGPKKVKGIGKSIAAKIDMFLQTGEMKP